MAERFVSANEREETRRITAAYKRRKAKERKRAEAAKKIEEEARSTRASSGREQYGPYLIEDVPVNREQYKTYRQLMEDDPAAADKYLELITPEGRKDTRKEGRVLSPDKWRNYQELVESGKKDLAETFYGKNPKEPPGMKRAREQATAESSGFGSAAATERRSVSEPARPSLPTVYREKTDTFEPLSPSMRAGRQSATEQFLTSKGQPITGGAIKAPLATGVNVSPESRIWLKQVGGIVAPSRGHMADPDAPGGRNAPGPSADQYSTINEYFIKLWDWTPLQRMEFQRAQGITATGEPDQATQDRWKNVLNHAARLTATGKKVAPEALFGFRLEGEEAAGGKRGGPGAPGGGPATTTEIKLTNRGSAKSMLNTVFKAKLGRSVSEDEVSTFLAALNAQERQAPTKRVEDTTATGALTTQEFSGGLNPEQFAEDYVSDVKGPEVNARMVGVDFLDAALKSIGAAV